MYIDFEDVLFGVIIFSLEKSMILYYEIVTAEKKMVAVMGLIFSNLVIVALIYLAIRKRIVFIRKNRLIFEYWKIVDEKMEINKEKNLILTERQKELLDQREVDLNELMKIVNIDLKHTRGSSNKLYRRKEKESIKRKLYDDINANKKEYYLI